MQLAKIDKLLEKLIGRNTVRYSNPGGACAKGKVRPATGSEVPGEGTELTLVVPDVGEVADEPGHLVSVFTAQGVLVDDPIHHLMLWSLICDRKKLAEVFWRNSSEPIACSLLACNLLRNVATQLDNHPTLLEQQEEIVKMVEYVELPSGLLSPCLPQHSSLPICMLALSELYLLCFVLFESFERT